MKRPPASAGGLFIPAYSIQCRPLAAEAAIESAKFSSDVAANLVDRRGNADGSGLRPLRLKPTGRQPLRRNRKFRVSAIQANLNVGLRGHGRMAHRTGNVAIEPDFSGNRGQGTGLALGTNH